MNCVHRFFCFVLCFSPQNLCCEVSAWSVFWLKTPLILILKMQFPAIVTVPCYFVENILKFHRSWVMANLKFQCSISDPALASLDSFFFFHFVINLVQLICAHQIFHKCIDSFKLKPLYIHLSCIF